MNIVEVKDLHKSFYQQGDQLEILLGIDFNVSPGESVAIVGHSGSGKSTLLSILAGLDAPTSGSIKITGQELSKLSEKELAKFRADQIGIVFQNFHLISYLTALENVALPLTINRRHEDEGEVVRALEKVGMKHRLHQLPTTLSGGEKQRVAIARALIVKPKLLLADEPSGNLDQETAGKTMDLLFKLVKDEGSTMILVTHNPELAAQCDRIYELKSGRLQVHA